jgi:aromatic aminotransferase
MTEAAGCWLVMDNTYEHFTYDGVEHTCVEGRNVINIFSFSKAYGMMGWRVGYICYPDTSVHASLGSQMLKVQASF